MRSASRKAHSGMRVAALDRACSGKPRSAPSTHGAATSQDVRRGVAWWLLQTSALRCSLQDRLERGVELRPAGTRAGRPCGDDDICAGWQLLEARADRLTQSATDAIADNSFADTPAHRNADTTGLEVIRRDVHDQQWVWHAARRKLANTAEVRRPTQPLRALHLSSGRESRRQSGACARAVAVA
jgi:hypothetical protein